jgi:tripartite-type tricarboxylate transporter receptor subunit TctC
MKFHRRRILKLGGASVALAALSRSALAQSYPARPVRLIVTIPAGGSPDIIGRLMAQWLSQRLGQAFVVDNRPGAASNIGTEIATKAAPDGYTLLLALSSNAINASLYRHLNYDFMRDTVPVAKIGTIPLIMEVNPAVPAQTVSEFIAYAKANPGKINMAAPGVGSPLYVAAELFKMMAGVDLVNVDYQGEAPAIPDLMSGQTQVMFGVMPSSIGYLQSGKLRALAVTSAKRQDVLPGIPTMNETLPGYEAYGWYGIVAPKGTPPDVVAKLNDEINAGLADPAIKKRLVELGCAVAGGSPADFGRFIAAETEKWAKVVAFAGIKVD